MRQRSTRRCTRPARSAALGPASHHAGRPGGMSPRMTRDRKAFDPSEVRAINETASALMKQASAVSTKATRPQFVEALSCFDRALDMRRGFPIDDEPLLRYGLEACPLNRGDASTACSASGTIWPTPVRIATRSIATRDPRTVPRAAAYQRRNRRQRDLSAGLSAEAVARRRKRYEFAGREGPRNRR